MKSNLFLNSCFLVIIGLQATVGQIPVEYFGGHEKSTVDIMFFKYFKNKQYENSQWLFFNRNRVSVDYEMTETSNLPVFGFTEAISYNHPKLNGIAPVLVAQIFSSGFYPKAGVQYALQRKGLTIFTWIVHELADNSSTDIFLLSRFTPQLTENYKLFTQFEFVNTLPDNNEVNFTFIQRVRLGLQRESWQYGGGIDLTQTGRDAYFTFSNIGVFIRHEF